MSLSEFRKQIDAIDEEILKKIRTRIDIVKKMADWKKKNDVDIFQPEREVELQKKRREICKKLEIPSALGEELFEKIIQHSRKIQDQKFQDPHLPNPQNLSFQKKSIPLHNKTLEELFESIAAREKNFFFLESLGEDEWSQHSFLGFAPAVIVQAKNDTFFINGTAVKTKKNPLQQLEEFFAPFSKISQEKSFCGGLVGFMGNNTASLYDPAIPPESEDSFPDFCFGLFLDGLIFDRKRKRLEYFFWDEDRSQLVQEILEETPHSEPLTAIKKETIPSAQQFEAFVEDMRQEIHAGNIYQIVPSQKKLYQFQGSLIPFYKKLREQNPSPHMYFLQFGSLKIIGSSPELVARVDGEKIETFPIAGTRSRGKTPQEDAKKAAEMLADEKEVSEHMMLVDMARNDLGKVCEPGSVQVERLMSIKKFSHVQHIVSEVSGLLNADVSPIRGILANFPMGTVCGSPRIEALKILRRTEKIARGPYGGTIGFWSFSGDAIFALLIRTLFAAADRAFTQAGAGVVYDSVPEHERKEIEKKAAHIVEILENFAR